MNLAFKTNWVLTDFFNVEDFNRIRDNIMVIKQLSLQAYKSYDILSIDLATYDKIELLNMMNAVERDVDIIASNTYKHTDFIPVIEQLKNTAFWDFDDLNRIENNLQKTHSAIVSAIENRCSIAMMLGGGAFADKIYSI